MTIEAPQTPMMRQHREAKEQHPDALLFFRMGDFYELFEEDAVIAARELGLTLTTRDKGRENPVPMCGVPHHAATAYLARLVRRGYKVAICEQLDTTEDGRGIREREVVKVLTPGTIFDTEMLDERAKNFLAAVVTDRTGTEIRGLGLALLEATTGELLLRDFAAPRHRDREDRLRTALADALDRYAPAELLLSESAVDDPLLDGLAALGIRRSPLADFSFGAKEAVAALRRVLDVVTLEGFGVDDRRPSPAARGAGALVAYLEHTQRSSLRHVSRLRVLAPDEGLVLDAATRQNLELVRTIRGEEGDGTLLGVLDRTRTPMGGRLLRDWILAPLTEVAPIRARQDVVEELAGDDLRLVRMGELLRGVGDLERLMSRVALGRATPREVLLVARSLERLPELGELAGGAGDATARLADRIDPVPELAARIATALAPDPPANTRDGGIFAPGFHAELDELRLLATDGKRWIADYEAREREATGIPSLKVRYNKVFGYFIEVTRPNLDRVPEDRYHRKQTLVGAERFITPELKDYEDKVLGAEERSRSIEQGLFEAFREEVAGFGPRVRETAAALAELDVLVAFALVARDRGYVRPVVDESGVIEIEAGRHPVVEVLSDAEPFVPNDTYLDLEDHQVILLTGPNMAGKSTVLRQVALITLLAQIGAFVPARRARIGVVDRIFTRVGASDNLARGQSTFLVEMQETAHICHNATRRSLVLLDEIGRGTSTFDGLSIAWAVAEYLHEAPHLGCKTLFATHYHELTELEGLLPRLKNYHVAVHEEDGKVVFLRRVERGGIDQSFGIHVARLAGMPREVVRRAEEVLQNLEASELDALGRPRRARGRPARGEDRPGQPRQLGLFTAKPHPVVEALQRMVPEEMTPLQALTKLDELRRMLAGGRDDPDRDR